MKSKLLMRIQGMEQEVCQLLLATFPSNVWLYKRKKEKIAAQVAFVATKEVTFVDANRLCSGKAANLDHLSGKS